MSVPVDIAITLLLSDSIIELKEGVWQSYSSNSVAETSHFYFLPKHKNKTLTLLYRSSTIDLKMLYTIWKTDDESINPAEWPFPRTQLQDHTKKAAQYSPSKFIVIDSQAFKFCWPSCVVLLSLILDKDSMRGTYNTFI